MEYATVYIPGGNLGYFLRKLGEYATQNTATGHPRNANLSADRGVAPRHDPRTMERRSRCLPQIRNSDLVGGVATSERRKRDRAPTKSRNPVRYKCRRSQGDFSQPGDRARAGDRNPAGPGARRNRRFCGLRAADVNSEFFTGLMPAEQADWINDLVRRTVLSDDDAPAACILDTGVNRGHPLLEHSLAVEDPHTCDPTWGPADHDGHGTEMAGVTLYGDVLAVLESGLKIRLRHRLESVKVLPPVNGTDPKLNGSITAEAVSRTEAQAPNRRRGFSMAITAVHDPIPGTPTSWPAAVDALAAGRAFDVASGELRYIDEAKHRNSPPLHRLRWQRPRSHGYLYHLPRPL